MNVKSNQTRVCYLYNGSLYVKESIVFLIIKNHEACRTDIYDLDSKIFIQGKPIQKVIVKYK